MDDNLKNTPKSSEDSAKTDSSQNAVPALADIKDAISKSDTMQQAITTAAGGNADGTDITTQMAERIIKEQEGIIGPVAYEQATKVQGIIIDQSSHQIK